MHIMCIPLLYIIVLMSFPEMGVSARMGFTPGPLSFQTFFKLWNPRTQWVDQWRFLDGKVMGKSSMNPGCSVAMLDCRRVKKNKTKWPVFSCKTDEQRWDFEVPDFSDKPKYAPFQPDTCCLAPKPTAIIVIVKAPLWTGCVFNLRQSGLVDTPSCNVHHFFVDSDDTPGIT